MNIFSKLLIPLLALPPLLLANDKDLINFKNSDTLHGNFKGLTTSGKIIWNNNSAEKNIAFTSEEVRKVVFNEGKLTKPFTHTNYVTLKNNDIIPGEIISLNNSEITIKPDFTENLIIPKKILSSIDINPLGAKILYRGPYSENEQWELKLYHKTMRSSEKTDSSKMASLKKNPIWKFKNFSFCDVSKINVNKNCAILKKIELPNRFRITYNNYNNNPRYHSSIILLADMQVPKTKTKEALDDGLKRRKHNNDLLAKNIGSCLDITLKTGTAQLHINTINKDGIVLRKTIENSIRSSYKINLPSKFFYDLRVDKEKGNILLFANKKLLGEWHVKDLNKKLNGSYFGYNSSRRYTSSTNILSDIVISSWNGVQDSAISLENKTNDIVLLSNGTDRYSGNIKSITENIVHFKSQFALMAIPVNQVNSINLAYQNIGKTPIREQDDVTVRFYGTGKITGKLSKGDNDSIILKSKILGKINIKYEYISSIEFEDLDYAYEVLK